MRGMGGLDPRKMQQMMKQMGIAQDEVDALRVEIILADRKIVIEPCQVSAVNAMGQKTYQVAGEEREESLDAKVEISDEDVETVAEQAGVESDVARAMLEETKGDLAEAIMRLKDE